MIRSFALLASVIAMPGLATAQTDLRADLTETFAPVNLNDNLVETLNCTSLYRALALLLGDDSELVTTFQEREGYMASLSGVMWGSEDANAEQTPEEVFAILVPPINTATEQYLSYMSDLAERSDAPFDDVIIDSVEFCNAIYGALQEEAP